MTAAGIRICGDRQYTDTCGSRTAGVGLQEPDLQAEAGRFAAMKQNNREKRFEEDCSAMTTDESLGSMPMPEGFRYAEVLRRGKPQHGIPENYATYDTFYIKHPPMAVSRRAKIFAPFDALRGFSEAVAAKQVLYESRRELTEGEREELDRRLGILQQMTAGSRSGRAGEKKQVPVTVTHFVPCRDPESEAFGKLGTYETLTGNFLKVDVHKRRILLDTGGVDIDEVSSIEGAGNL